ncbi:MAG: hypothetical protein IJO05_08995 [Oscillospiraceae bacterium]|nr:hypothetical protein [Oscillospiraceae bacterium]
MQTITVRKPRSHRATSRMFAVFSVLVPVLLTVCFRQLLGVMLLLCLPAIAVSMGVLLYDESWRVCFDANGVQKAVFGIAGKHHCYNEIKDVVSRCSVSEHGVILRIIFNDGGAVKFRMQDENGEKARKYILSRHTIRNLE